MRLKLTLAFLLMTLSSSLTAQSAQPQRIFTVAQVLKEKKSGDVTQILVKSGTKEGILEGDMMIAYRQAKGLWIELATLTAVYVQEHVSMFDVKASELGQELNKKLLPKYNGIMAGDLVMRKEQLIAQRTVMSPVMTVPYNKLFVDADSGPTTFELSDTGLTKLEEVMKAFGASRVETLMVEGYTDHNGPAEMNQVESYERARAVRQVLIDKFGFDPERVLAFGFGEAEQVDRTFAPGSIDRNRRIVFKIVPVVEE